MTLSDEIWHKVLILSKEVACKKLSFDPMTACE